MYCQSLIKRGILFIFILLLGHISKALAGGGPSIMLRGSDTIYVEMGESYVDSGVIVLDSTGTPVSGATAVVSVTPKYNNFIPGTYRFTYSYRDASGMSATPVNRIVVVTPDVTPPVLTIDDTSTIYLYLHDLLQTPSVISAIDKVDGNITASVVVQHSVNTGVAGTYYITYSITDFSGNKTEIKVRVVVQVRTWKIEGTLTLNGSSRANLDATVYLIQYDSADSTLTAVKTYPVTGKHTYSFTGLQAGNYLVKAALDSGDSSYASYLPTYYGNEFQWSNASMVSVVNGNMTADIELIAGSNSGGPGFVGGKVTQGANKKGDPMPGVQIILTTKDGKAVAYTFSRADGTFQFTNLALGEYLIYGEVGGKPAVSAAVKLDQDHQSQSKVTVEVNSNSVVADVEEEPQTRIEGQHALAQGSTIYPVPASTLLNVSAGERSICGLGLYTISGQSVRSAVFISGQNQTALDVSDLPAGIYILKLNYTDGSATERRMISVAH